MRWMIFASWILVPVAITATIPAMLPAAAEFEVRRIGPPQTGGGMIYADSHSVDGAVDDAVEQAPEFTHDFSANDRETIPDREAAVAKREAAVAQREQSLARREAEIAEREKRYADYRVRLSEEYENYVKKLETLKAAEAAFAQRQNGARYAQYHP